VSTLAELRARLVAAREERDTSHELLLSSNWGPEFGPRVRRYEAAETAYDDARDALLLALVDAPYHGNTGSRYV